MITQQRLSRWAANVEILHGWVVEVDEHCETQDFCSILLKRADRSEVQLFVSAGQACIEIGSEISVAMAIDLPNLVLVLVDRHAGRSYGLSHLPSKPWPSRLDTFILVAAAAFFAAQFGWASAPVTIALSTGWWLLGAKLPAWRRIRTEAVLDYLVDRDYHRWRRCVDRPEQR